MDLDEEEDARGYEYSRTSTHTTHSPLASRTLRPSTISVPVGIATYRMRRDTYAYGMRRDTRKYFF
eukprot:scaffold562005_cov43-Prasinocladus_malaysianus.AAC.1